MNLRGVSYDTWVRIIALFVILVNQVSISFFGAQLVPFTDEQVYQEVSTVGTIVVTVWAAWKNNSFTNKAQRADRVLKGGK